MKIKSNLQECIFAAVMCIITAFLTAFLWYVHFPFDAENGDFGAVHIIFNVLATIGVGFFAVWFVGDLTLLDKEIKKEYTIPKKYIVIPLIFIGFIIFLSMCGSPFSKMTEMYNKHIDYVNQYEKIEYERKSYFDKMYKTYLQKNNICEINKDVFIETTKIIMEGRHDGEHVAWKWVKENQHIPYEQFSTFYFNLSIFVHEQREGYYKLEKEAMEVVRAHNTMIDIFPNNMYNKVLNIDHMVFEPGFTSIHTDTVFTNKHENLE